MKSKTTSLPAPRLVVRLRQQAEDPVEWAIYQDDCCKDVQALSRENLSELAALPAARHTHLLVPVEKATCITLMIPDENYELTDQKLHWLADDTLDEDAPSLHWTLLSRHGTRLVVAGIEKAWLDAELKTLSSAGLNIVHASLDALYLPATENGWTVLKDGDTWLVRTQEGVISRLTETWLRHLMTHFVPQQLTHYGELPEPRQSTLVKSECHIMALFADIDMPNLLHDSVRPPARLSPWTGRLKSVSLYSIALAAGIALLVQGACYWQLLGLEKQLRNTLAQQWQRYIPENQHRSNVRVWLPKQLKQHPPAPFALLLQLQSGLAPFPGLALEGVGYNSQKKSLQIYLYASDENQVQQFIKHRIAGFSLKIDKHEQGLWTLSND